MNLIKNIAGELCKIILPINEEIFLGDSKSSMAICTLSSMKLLKEISNSNLISQIAVVGRLLTENKGIDSLIKYVISKKNIKIILVCGKDTAGHRSGHSLLKLCENGVDSTGRIINSFSPEPFLSTPKFEIEKFREQITIIDEVGETNIHKIKALIDSLLKI